MSSSEPNQTIREAARDVLREIVPEIMRELTADANGKGHTNGNRNGHAPRPPAGDELVVPRVPAPPVAAVLRPSTWDRPAAPGEVIGAPGEVIGAPGEVTGARAEAIRAPASAAVEQQASPTVSGGDARVETVKIETDEDLERFIRELMTRLENPRERLAIRKGELRFLLRGTEIVGQPQGAPPVRVKKGAVTERVIRQAASAGTRLVLAPGAVLTPLARDQAKALGVQIEKERRC
jgi:hypothetical protein